MPLETATYFTDLVTSNPAHTDGLNQGDAHLRLIKSTLQASFKNWTSTSGVGSVAYLNSTQAQLDNAVNLLTGVSGAAAFPAGTAGAPSIAFTGDPDSGLYKAGEDLLSLSVNGGAVQFEVGTTGAFLSAGGLTVGSNYNNGSFVPPGAILMYQGALPAGYAWLNGGTVPSASNPVLASIYGASGGNVTLPDWRDFVPIGQGTMGGTSDRGVVTLSGIDTMNAGIGEASHTLVTAELPVITPTGSFSGNLVSLGTINLNNPLVNSIGGGGNITGPGTFNAGAANTITSSVTIPNFTPSGSISINSFGSGGAHNNVQPSVVTGFIIKLG